MAATISASRQGQGPPLHGPDAPVRPKPSHGRDALAPPQPRQTLTRPTQAGIHGFSALTLTDAGEPVLPETSDDWAGRRTEAGWNEGG